MFLILVALLAIGALLIGGIAMASDSPLKINDIPGVTGPWPATFNFGDLLSLAELSGFSGTYAQTAAAIALAESSGNPNAVGDNGTSIGLWQIHFTVHPEFDQSKLTDPAYNGAAAFALYSRKGNFTDWTTFKTGAYRNYLQV